MANLFLCTSSCVLHPTSSGSNFCHHADILSNRYALALLFSKGLGASLTDIDHRGRSGGQRFLLPIAVTRADLKPIVVEQGFHLLRKDVAQGRAKHLLLALPSWMEKREKASVVLDLGHGIVVLLLHDHELPPIRQRVLLSFWTTAFQEIVRGRIACFKEKTSLSITGLIQFGRLLFRRENSILKHFMHIVIVTQNRREAALPLPQKRNAPYIPSAKARDFMARFDKEIDRTF